MANNFNVRGFLVEPSLNRISRGDQVTQIEPRVMELLVYLADHAGKVLSRDRIIRAVWSDTFVTDEALWHGISELRRVFGDDAKSPEFIETISKRGYRLIAPVSPEVDANDHRFRILEKIGQGAMGQVYLTEDTTLKRKVALKFLNEEVEQDKTARRRLLREARATAALDHPFICKVYETGELDGRSFIAMEYVEGETLKERLARGPIGLKEALRIAVEVADALEAAAEKKIVHRDVKPSNILLAKQGHVKVTDFGVARRLQRSEEEDQEWTATLTEDITTVGTLPYMSPEQVRGDPVDHRSDIFSFGVVLYELLTGVHPFRKARQVETTAAILRTDPAPLKRYIDDVPELLQCTVRKMLAKDPSQRYQSAHEVGTNLTEVLGELEVVHEKSGFNLKHLVGTAVAATLMASGGIWIYLSQTPAEPILTDVKITGFTSLIGTERHPAFSPDGSQVAFSWDSESQDNFDIYIKPVGPGQMRRLTTDPGEDFRPVWSPDGSLIAFMRRQGEMTKVMLVPPLGGIERELTETYFNRKGTCYLRWSPNSRWLAVSYRESPGEGVSLYLFSVETDTQHRLTSPPIGDDLDPDFSPDGRKLAFIRKTATGVSELYLLRLSEDLTPAGEPERLTFENRWISSPIWSESGQSIFYSLEGDLWQVQMTKPREPRRRRVLAGPGNLGGGFVISHRTRRLIYEQSFSDRNIWRIQRTSSGDTNPPVKLIASTRNDSYPAYSPNGQGITYLSRSSGHPEIWRCDAEGLNPQQLTRFEGPMGGSPDWSPDGRWIVLDPKTTGNSDIYRISVIPGEKPKQLTFDAAMDGVPTWSRDGKWIYFGSDRSGEWQIWKIPADGGQPVPVTQRGGFKALESYDGKFLYYSKPVLVGMVTSIWKKPLAGGEEARVIDSLYNFYNFAVVEGGIYYFAKPSPEGRAFLEFFSFDSETKEQIWAIDEELLAYGVAATRDGLSILYTQIDQRGSDLMLVENFTEVQ